MIVPREILLKVLENKWVRIFYIRTIKNITRKLRLI